MQEPDIDLPQEENLRQQLNEAEQSAANLFNKINLEGDASNNEEDVIGFPQSK